MGNFRDRLKAYSDNWKKAKKLEGGGNLPDGQYQCKVAKALLTEGKKGTKSEGQLRISFWLKVISGKHIGKYCFRNINPDLATEDKPLLGLDMLKTDMATLGVEDFKISQLEEHLKEVLDKVVDVQVKNKTTDKGTFPNVYIQSLVEPPEDIEEDEDEDEDADKEPDKDDDDEEEKPSKKEKAKTPKKDDDDEDGIELEDDDDDEDDE